MKAICVKDPVLTYFFFNLNFLTNVVMNFESGVDYDPRLQGDLKINEKCLLKLNKI